MTLKEKLEVEIMDFPIMDEVVEDIAKNLEYVADEFAIGFAEWICQKAEISTIDGKMNTTLEIYKKEKGL